MDGTTQVTDLLDSLPNSENKGEKLNELKILLLSTNAAALSQIVPNVSFDAIFECFSTDDGEQIMVCCDVIEHLLGVMDPSSLLQQFHTDFLHGLCHPEQPVQQLSLKQVEKVATTNPQQVIQYPDIVLQLIQLLRVSHLGTAKQAALILIQLCQSVDGLEMMLTGEALSQLQSVLDAGDVIRFRVYELCVDIARLSPHALLYCSHSGLLQQLINEIHKDDILLQLNCLELLSRLATSEHGLLHLDQQGIVAKLDQMLRSVDSDPLMGFLLPGLVKFFGNVAHLHPKEALTRFDHFTQLLFSLLGSADLTKQVLALETLGFIGKSVEGKLVLEKHSPAVRNACRQVGTLSKQAPTELKLRSMDALINLLHLEVADQTAELLALTESWFKSLATSPMDHLLDQAKQPYQDMRCAIYRVLQVVAALPWGQTIMNLHPGFNEFILDRFTETQKDCKVDKFKIVKTLVDSPTSMDIFGRPYYMRLKVFRNEGPFFIKVETSVALEGAD